MKPSFTFRIVFVLPATEVAVPVVLLAAAVVGLALAVPLLSPPQAASR